MDHLGQRLQRIADMVPDGARLADIGSDHAHLPVYLVQKGTVVFAVAGEVNAGPYDSACRTVQRLSLDSMVSVRRGDGLAVVQPGEVNTAVIAGMGGTTIVQILSAQPAVVASLEHLILQPMTGSAPVRLWLHANNWRICDEVLAAEDARLYEIIRACHGRGAALDSIMAEVGPVLWQKKDPLLAEHIRQLIRQKEHVLEGLRMSPGARASVKYDEYLTIRNRLEEMACQLPAK